MRWRTLLHSIESLLTVGAEENMIEINTEVLVVSSPSPVAYSTEGVIFFGEVEKDQKQH